MKLWKRDVSVSDVTSEYSTASGQEEQRKPNKGGASNYCPCLPRAIPYSVLNAVLSVGLLVGVTLAVWLVTFTGARDSANDLADGVQRGLILSTKQLILPFFQQQETETLVLVKALQRYGALLATNQLMPEEVCLDMLKLFTFFLNATEERQILSWNRAAPHTDNKMYVVEHCDSTKYDEQFYLSTRTINATLVPANMSLPFPPTRVIHPIPQSNFYIFPLHAPPVAKYLDVWFPTGYTLDGTSLHDRDPQLDRSLLRNLSIQPVWEGEIYFTSDGMPTYSVMRWMPTLDYTGMYGVASTSAVTQFSSLLRSAVSGKQRMWMSLQKATGYMIGVSHGKSWSHSDLPRSTWSQTNRTFLTPQQSTDPIIQGAAILIYAKHGRTWDLPDLKEELKVEGERWLLLSIALEGHNRRARIYLLQDRATLLGRLDDSFRRSIGIFAGMLVFGLVTSVAFSVLVTSPLRELQSAINLVTTMEFRVVRRKFGRHRSAIREVQQLQRSFHAMVTTMESFSNYVPVAVVQRILRRGRLPKLEMEEKVLTVLFVDIQGFTELSSEMPPDEVVLLLGETLSVLTAEVTHNEGIVDKYIGDCVMALWNAPEDVDHQQAKACAAALGCVQGSEELGRRLRSLGLPEVRYRIGMASGLARVGNVGCSTRFNYTAIGDTVNVAARLEAANKHFGTAILVTASVQQNAADKYAFANLGLLQVVGRAEPVGVFELRGRQEQDSQEDRYCKQWNAAMRLYLNRNFVQARELFRSLADGAAAAAAPDPASQATTSTGSFNLGRGEKAQRLFLSNAERFAKQPPHDDWNGMEVMGQK